MRRTFIAVKADAGESLRSAISDFRTELRNENIRWIDVTNLHITLAFIGDTEESLIKKIVSTLNNDLAGFGNISFRFSGFGLFRNFNDPRIIWTGIEDTDQLSAVYEIVSRGMNQLNLRLEDRKFKPHLTIGRIKDMREISTLQKLINKYSGVTFQVVSVSDIVYYESILLPTGPLYKPISIIPL